MTTVLLLESDRANGDSFVPHLDKRYELVVTHTGKEALILARENIFDVLVLNSASMRTSGDRICASLRNEVADIPIIHIKPGPPPTGKQKDSPADVLLYQPFTYRKLINRIDRYAKAEEHDILKQGPFTLNLSTLVLQSPIGEKKLTPKLAKLMQIFMQTPNELIERKRIIKEVWQTDYMGDTRTLDVHIRWIRQAVEPNSSKPQYIKTVRGKGYRLEL